VGLLPGADPALAGEAVVIGAHLDHVGRQGPDLVFPGANDNASGAAAVLALADALAHAPRRPARTVVFALFTGEEHGLNGARWHAAHPAAPLARTVAMLNLDCVACGDSLQLGNGRSAPNLWRLARDLDAAGERITVERTWAGGGADATPFHEAGVPSLYLATTRGYEQLHLPSDLPATLNGTLYERVVRLALRTATAVAGGGYAREALRREEPARGP
jgi:Zn-dependent M28 family amino/carboxypeptidase